MSPGRLTKRRRLVLMAATFAVVGGGLLVLRAHLSYSEFALVLAALVAVVMILEGLGLAR